MRLECLARHPQHRLDGFSRTRFLGGAIDPGLFGGALQSLNLA
jgi:hypothetical protein